MFLCTTLLFRYMNIFQDIFWHMFTYVYICFDMFTYVYICFDMFTYLIVPTGETYPDNQARDCQPTTAGPYVTPLLSSRLTTWCVVERLDIIVRFAGVRCSGPGINFVHSSSNLPVRGSKLDI